jgi:uncharacterized protein YukE
VGNGASGSDGFRVTQVEMKQAADGFATCALEAKKVMATLKSEYLQAIQNRMEGQHASAMVALQARMERDQDEINTALTRMSGLIQETDKGYNVADAQASDALSRLLNRQG